MGNITKKCQIVKKFMTTKEGKPMLKGIDPVLNAELLHALMLMGHGDQLVLCDINHPAETIAKHDLWQADQSVGLRS